MNKLNKAGNRIILVTILFFNFILTNAQVPDMGIASTFVLFTNTGAITSTGITSIYGNVGNYGAGLMGGFDTSNTNGNYWNGNNSIISTNTASAISDAYNQLNVMPATVLHVPTSFGNGETLFTGVYYKGMASTLDGVLTLDAQGDTNAVFIFKINGALTTGAGATMVLVNKASINNVFFVVEGAMTFAAGNILRGTFIANNGAIVCGAGCNVIGRLLSTTGAVTVDTFTGSLPNQSMINYWTGNAGTSNWFTRQNWTHHVPNGLSATIIPNDIPVGNLYPIITNGTALVTTLGIESNASVFVNNGILSFTGDIDNAGILDATKGTVEIHDSISPGLDAATFTYSTVQNLSLFYNVILLGKEVVTGTLKFSGSNITLNAGNFLTLKSTSAGTASIGDLTSNGTQSGNKIIGNISIERYIPQKRAWRLLAAPISPATVIVPTINTAWQEGVTLSNPNLGYGVQITGGIVANGFDLGVNTNPSLKYYDNSKNVFVGLPNVPGTNIPINTYPGYFIFVRGDRSTQLSLGLAAASTCTTLRMQGQINNGPVQSNIYASNLSMVGNPYPSAINFASIYANNSSVINNMFYAWDPQLGGTYGVGGYVTISGNSDGTYSITPSTSTLTQYIESGQAFFVTSASGVAGTITIKETDKVNTKSNQVFKSLIMGAKQVSINLLGFQANDSSYFIIDGVHTDYNDKNNNSVDKNDITKLFNLSENIGISRGSKLLTLERRHTIENNDTTFLNLSTLNNQQYKLVITSNGMDKNGLYALLKDKYDAKLNNTQINLNGETEISFKVDKSAAESYAPDRFSIVFAKLSNIPATLINVTASVQQNNIIIKYNIINEIDVAYYNVERSSNGLDFTAGTKIFASKNNGGAANYNWLDSSIAEGSHYYRILATGITGKKSYSTVVRIKFDKSRMFQSLVASPNTIIGNTISYKINNLPAGTYAVELYKIDGVLLKKETVVHNGDNTVNHIVYVNNNLAAGKYLLQLSNNILSVNTSLIK